ncbi:MAG: Penicillin-binding protein 2 [Candidatus Magasanikbacteria bacterium GW2011_GWA2_45_39]|uniref:Penicillin-binding protein 2 n=2 Tax=Candidatus Magasanikiibacteriota TaxID=1752731 RepID=A0A0G1QXR6_9BACT|nr:MAG: Penicillin-binding protein 2 [Candidatus Magasanikbacteria bacterium GW2011_GWA2_45_39]KKU13495.1 MAG: Penicillin-binding protein 2 [Candidatus Magasanikbacteria bacterium GW2011_GWC2_45_8]HBW73916.1 penicillin-binding protein 2 [Candidatus Magasanikbacteria bacterium]
MKRIFSFKRHQPNDDPFLIRIDSIKDKSVEGFFKKQWVEDSITTAGKINAPKPLGEFLGIGGSLKTLWVGGCILTILLVTLFLRAAYLQIIQGGHFRLLAENNRIRTKLLSAERGIIYDATDVPLVRNIPTFTAYLLPQDIPTENHARTKTLRAIGELVEISPENLQKKMDEFKSYRFQTFAIKDNIDYDTALRLVLLSKQIPGVSIESELKRQYLLVNEGATSSTSERQHYAAPSLGMVLGYEGKITKEELDLASDKEYLPIDRIGKTGIEKSYENLLRGVRAKKKIEVDALGKTKNLIAEEPGVPGKNIKLNIRVDYQTALEDALDAQLKNSTHHRASAIVMNPQTGAILALATRPVLDTNLFAKGISNDEYQQLLNDPDQPLFNRAWSGAFPSGSVIKPLIASAALTEKIITRNTTFLSVGGLQVGKWFFPDWKAGGHGVTNVIKALAESVNTFFFIVGGGYHQFKGLGPETIVMYLKKFGLANTTGIDLPGEVPGFLPTPEWKEDVKKEQWYIGDTYNLSIGQGDVLVTPLQVALYTATVANSGTLYAPHVVKSTIDPKTKKETPIKPRVVEHAVVPADVLALVRAGMRSAVTDGSARVLNDLPIPVAGKTGTAQWSKNKANHAWFTGFAPYENPRIVITVLVEEGGEGSGVSVPIAKRFLTWYAKHTNE